MRIRVYLSGVQYHPEPDALRLRAGGVVPRQRVGQADGQPGDQPALRHLRRQQYEDAVAPVFGRAVGPVDPGTGEGPLQRPVHRVAHDHPVEIRPGRVAKAFHVNDQDCAVDRWLKHPDASSRARRYVEAWAWAAVRGDAALAPDASWRRLAYKFLEHLATFIARIASSLVDLVDSSAEAASYLRVETNYLFAGSSSIRIREGHPYRERGAGDDDGRFRGGTQGRQPDARAGGDDVGAGGDDVGFR